MANSTLGLVYEVSADPSKAVQALAQFRDTSQRESSTVLSHFSALQEGADRARRSHEAAFGAMTTSVQSFGNATVRVLADVAEGLLRNMDLDQLDVAQKNKTEASKLSISKRGVQDLAVVKAAESFAKGLEALGDLNFWSATQYFAASALYGSLAAVQISSLLGSGSAPSLGPGGGATASIGARSAVAGPVQLAPGAASAVQQPSGNVTVLVMGEPQAAAWLTKTINGGVLQQDLMLVASHTKRSAPAGR
jgi:hypothetical protein